MKKIVWVVAILVIVLILIFLGLYQFAGLKQYFQVLTTLRALPVEQRAKDEFKFYHGGDGQGQYGYTGMLAYADKNGLWVWGGKGPKYFRADKDTMFVTWSVCDPATLEKIASKQPFSPNQYATANISEWRPKERVGQFVDIRVAAKLNGGIEGNMREARAYDWWVFTVVDMEAQCKK